jgi:hypothetical protein
VTVGEDSCCRIALIDCTSDPVGAMETGCSCMTDSVTVGKSCARDHQNGNVSDARRNMNDFCSFPWHDLDLENESVSRIGES